MSGLTMEIKQERRLCTVRGDYGYFHTWEHYTNSSGQSGVYGLVEFEDSVRRVEPTCIKFCDEENEMLSLYKDPTKRREQLESMLNGR
jgi:hypothetical protein